MAVIIAIASILGGCAWTPERDNPRDPASEFYQEPPQPNVAPVIDTLYMSTECRNHAPGQFCLFTVFCRAHDANGNLDFDSVTARIQLFDGTWIDLGQMSYNADEAEFFLTKTQNDFENQTLDPLVHRPMVITVRDNGDMLDTSTVFFQVPLDDYPIMLHPRDNDVVPTRNPSLGWAYWGDTTTAQTFEVAVYLQGYLLEWDTAGLAAADTSVIITSPLRTSNADPQLFYTWALTAVDEHGNRATARPMNFSVLIPDTLTMPPEQGIQ